jgi:hypothetical protein
MRLFRAFRAALKPGGTLYVEVPNGDAMSVKRHGENAYYLGAPVHVHLFSRRSLAILAERAGLVVVSSWTRSAWRCHYLPRALELRLRRRSAPGAQFEDASRTERWRAQVLSAPQFLLSQRQGMGDSVFIETRRPEA